MLKNRQRHLRNQTTRKGGKANLQMSLSSQRRPRKSKTLSSRTFPSQSVTIHQRARSGITSSQSFLSQFGQLPRLYSSPPSSLFCRFRLLADPDLRPPAIAPHWWCVLSQRSKQQEQRDRFERGSPAAASAAPQLAPHLRYQLGHCTETLTKLAHFLPHNSIHLI